MPAAVEAENIAYSVPLPTGTDLPILKGASLSVPEGGSAAILGRSGSGKTTLLSILGLMSRATTGRVRFGGVDVTRLPDAAAADLRNQHLGFVFQDFSLITHLSVAENVELPFRYGAVEQRAAVHARVRQVLGVVGLTGFEHRPVRQLSGGEQQRVAIARALARSPRLVLADEPTGALDTDTGREVLAVLREAATGTGAGLLVVTHDNAIAATADQRWLLADGTLRPITGESAVT